MNNTNLLLILGAALLLAPATITPAQSNWQTVADFQCAAPATVDALAKDSAGNLYAAICTSDAEGRMHAVVRKSSDHGATWTVIEDYLHPGQSATRYLSLGVDPTDSQYAVGYTEGKDQQTRWIVRKSGKGGNSWSTVDDFIWPGGKTTAAQSLAADSTGNLYVAGYGGQAGWRPHWLVRQSRDGGRNWSTIDDFTYGFSAKAFAILSTSNGLFVAGQVGVVIPKLANVGSCARERLMARAASAGRLWMNFKGENPDNGLNPRPVGWGWMSEATFTRWAEVTLRPVVTRKHTGSCGVLRMTA